jgi:hypothetical protein
MPTVNNGGRFFWGSAFGSSAGAATLRSDTTEVVSFLFVSAPAATVSVIVSPTRWRPLRSSSMTGAHPFGTEAQPQAERHAGRLQLRCLGDAAPIVNPAVSAPRPASTAAENITHW